MKNYWEETKGMNVDEKIAYLKKEGFYERGGGLWRRDKTKLELLKERLPSIIVIMFGFLFALLAVISLIVLGVVADDIHALLFISAFVSIPVATFLLIAGIIKYRSILPFVTFAIDEIFRKHVDGVPYTPVYDASNPKNYDSTKCFNCKWYEVCHRTSCHYVPKK